MCKISTPLNEYFIVFINEYGRKKPYLIEMKCFSFVLMTEVVL